MTVCETRLMVAVPGTQRGATTRTFDEERFLRELLWPVKNFFAATNEVYPVLIFFLVGKGSQYEERVTIPLPEENEGNGCPGYLAAGKHLHLEIKRGLVSLACYTGDDAEQFEKAIDTFMGNRGIVDRRILTPRRLTDLASELTSS